jgi:predicted secreted protein
VTVPRCTDPRGRRPAAAGVTGYLPAHYPVRAFFADLDKGVAPKMHAITPSRRRHVRPVHLAVTAAMASAVLVAGTAQAMALPASGTAGGAVPAAASTGAPVPESRHVDVYGPEGLPTTAILLVVGDTISVHLREAAGSTGYSWSPTSIPSTLELTKDVVIPPKPPSPTEPAPPGTPGDHVFTLTVTSPGPATATFSLRRSWEPEPIKTVSVTIRGRW